MKLIEMKEKRHTMEGPVNETMSTVQTILHNASHEDDPPLIFEIDMICN